MEIVDLSRDVPELLRQAATILVEAFREHSPHAWSDIGSAEVEINEAIRPDRIMRGAVNDDGILLGWVGAISEYNGNAWELHPLAVHPDHQGKGIGRALVADLEQRVLERGGITIFLGADDEDGLTNLSDRDLYPSLLDNLKNIQNLKRHPFEFYQKIGYSIVGVIPDANGLGKPDILMAKRIA